MVLVALPRQAWGPQALRAESWPTRACKKPRDIWFREGEVDLGSPMPEGGLVSASLRDEGHGRRCPERQPRGRRSKDGGATVVAAAVVAAVAAAAVAAVAGAEFAEIPDEDHASIRLHAHRDVVVD